MPYFSSNYFYITLLIFGLLAVIFAWEMFTGRDFNFSFAVFVIGVTFFIFTLCIFRVSPISDSLIKHLPPAEAKFMLTHCDVGNMWNITQFNHCEAKYRHSKQYNLLAQHLASLNK